MLGRAQVRVKGKGLGWSERPGEGRSNLFHKIWPPLEVSPCWDGRRFVRVGILMTIWVRVYLCPSVPLGLQTDGRFGAHIDDVTRTHFEVQAKVLLDAYVRRAWTHSLYKCIEIVRAVDVFEAFELVFVHSFTYLVRVRVVASMYDKCAGVRTCRINTPFESQ